MTADAHCLVEDDDALERRTEGEDAMCLVILFLLTHEEEAHLGVVYHKLYLLLAARGIEWDGDSPNAPRSEVAIEILRTVVGEDADILLHLHTEVEQCVRRLLDGGRQLVPRQRLPLGAAKVLVDYLLTIAILLGLLVHQNG